MLSHAQVRVLQLKRSEIPERLVKGAAILGQLFRAGQRCVTGGWSRRCVCKPLSEFCLVKLRWIELFLDWGPEFLLSMTGEEEYFVAECFDMKMLEASSLGVRIAAPGGLPEILLGGPKGTTIDTFVDLVEVGEPGGPEMVEAWKAVAKVQGITTVDE